MKKNLLIIAATASFILVACEKNDTYRQAVQDDTQLPMAFSAYTGKITWVPIQINCMIFTMYSAYMDSRP